MNGFLSLLAIVLVGTQAPAGPKPAGEIKDFALVDIKGRLHSTREWKDQKAVVLVFLGTECPVSNGYSPEYRRLVETYGGKGVLFYGVHPDPDVTAQVAAKHAEEYRLTWVVLLDPTQKVAKQAGVRVVPEAVVLGPHGSVLYRGRIDDLYTREGRRRERPSTRDLEDALKATLAGKMPAVRHTEAFGCPLPEPVGR